MAAAFEASEVPDNLKLVVAWTRASIFATPGERPNGGNLLGMFCRFSTPRFSCCEFIINCDPSSNRLLRPGLVASPLFCSCALPLSAIPLINLGPCPGLIWATGGLTKGWIPLSAGRLISRVPCPKWNSAAGDLASGDAGPIALDEGGRIARG